MDDLIAEIIAETTESLNLLDSELVKFERDPVRYVEEFDEGP